MEFTQAGKEGQVVFMFLKRALFVFLGSGFLPMLMSCSTLSSKSSLTHRKPDQLVYTAGSREIAQDRISLNDRQVNEAFNAAVSGKVDVLNRFYNEGYDLKIKNQWGGETLAFTAARHERVNVLEFLHRIGHDLNAPNNLGETPEDYAKRHEKVKVLEFLRSKGYNVDIPNKKEQLPRFRNEKSRRGENSRTSGEANGERRTREAAKKELHEKFGISDPNAKEATGRPVVFSKTYTGPEDLKLFLEAGLDPDIRGPGDWDSLSGKTWHVSLLQHVDGKPELLRMVLAAGANPHKPAFIRGRKPDYKYIVTNKESQQILLREAGVPPQRIRTDSLRSGTRLSNEALDVVNENVVNSDLTDRQKENRRLLHTFAIDPKPSHLRNLLRRRSFRRMIDIDNGFGSSPLLMAMKHGLYKNAANLLAQGADPNAKDPFGNTALHYAAIFYGQGKGGRLVKDIDIVRALYAVGGDPSIKNDFGKTPLDEVNIRGTGDKEVTKILSKRKKRRMRCF